MIILQWALPTDMTTSFISRYTVDSKAGMLMIPPLSPVTALTIENCNLNVTVGIHAIDICDRQGAKADILQDVTKHSDQTTAAAQPGN